MIVLDASVVVDLLLRQDPEPIEQIAFADPSTWQAPHLLDVEVASALRRFASRGDIPGARATAAIVHLAALPIERHDHEPLLARIWQLRHTHTAYDATYVALAEALQATLLTRDGRLASSHGHAATIVKI